MAMAELHGLQMGVILTTSELTLHQRDIGSLARTSGMAFSTLGLKNRFVKLDHFPNFRVKIKKYMGGSKNRGTPKWMVKIMEIPIQMDDLGGKNPIFGFPPILKPSPGIKT